jgi:uncharacterized membrane protein
MSIFLILSFLVWGLLPGIAAYPLFRRMFANNIGVFFISTSAGIATTLVVYSLINRVLPFPIFSYLASLITIAFLSHFAKQKLPDFRVSFKQRIKLEFPQMLLFLLCFGFFLFLRTLFPDITFDPNRLGAEKLFNLQFLNSFQHARFYPPESLWMAGTPVGYYILPKALPGLFLALSSNLTSLSPQHLIGIVFHISDVFWIALAICTLAQSILNIWNTGPNLILSATATLLALFPYMTGPWRALYEAYSSGRVELWGLSRIIENTVNEYPIWNFFWADNHSHSNVLPFQFCFAFLFVDLLRHLQKRCQNSTNQPVVFAHIIFLATLATTIAMSHSGSVFIALVFCSFYTLFHLLPSPDKELNIGNTTPVLWLISMTLLLFLPDFLTRPQPNVKWYFVPSQFRSTLAEFFNIYFSQLLLAVLFTITFLSNFRVKFRLKFNLNNIRNLPKTPIAAIATLLGLLLFPEFVASNWDMGDKYMRYNTLFRFLFESYFWAPFLLAIAIGPFLKQAPHSVLSFSLVTLMAIFVYPHYLTLKARLEFNTVHPISVQTLDGLAWFQKENPADWQLADQLSKIQKLLPATPLRIAEECGMPPKPHSYSPLGRISALTGFPAVCGWGHHVNLFQKPSPTQRNITQTNSTWAQLLEREKWLKELYSTNILSDESKLGLQALGITHLVFGTLEKQNNPALTFADLAPRGKTIYQTGEYGIIELALP